ncbi:hypothetical protein GYMLUDRAFT_588775 [Collybiopsis luxurians FD-317 M1]|uniref:C2H2-type domain-containing protein n=1 Tax=Collybiopsis luxurians FD-317 M1 TaxID=944289 RepID=A0A0D0CQ35_9AGAR|nr:hypothetical protein GYMLUDRAFT_588775 [Collybiopsis luxurians FD-317 M1]
MFYSFLGVPQNLQVSQFPSRQDLRPRISQGTDNANMLEVQNSIPQPSHGGGVTSTASASHGSVLYHNFPSVHINDHPALPVPVSSIECRIIEEGKICSERLTMENYKEHFAQEHNKDNSLECRWNGCGTKLAARHRLFTHRETHDELGVIRLKFFCEFPRCEAGPFAREDILTRHKKVKHFRRG